MVCLVHVLLILFDLYIYIYIFKDEIANNEIQQRSNRNSIIWEQNMHKTNHNNHDFARIKKHKDNTIYPINLICMLKSLPHSIATLIESSIKINDSSLWENLWEAHSRQKSWIYIQLTLLRSESKDSLWIQAIIPHMPNDESHSHQLSEV